MKKPVQTISLDVSHAGVKIYDKIFKVTMISLKKNYVHLC